MIEYANESVIKVLKQYEMLSKSLKFTTDLKQKQEICYQMTLLIEKVINITNKVYEEKYLKTFKRSTYLMDEEKNRLLELINLINERRTYVNNQISNNIEVTGINLDPGTILGEDKLEEFKEEVKIIEKYKNNIKQDSILKEEIVVLENNIKKANEKINSNKNLNRQLEDRMKKIVDGALNKLALYELQEREKEIDLAYTELGYSLEKAKENAKIARKDCTPEIILECDNMLASITLEYERYKEKKLILRLIEIYKNPVDDYDDLLKKREEMNTILSGITSSDLYLEIGNELNKEYATIKLEKQDRATLESLIEERDSKKRLLKEINEENASEQFKGILATLLENEKKYQEHLLQEKKRKEEERKLKALEEEKRRQQEMVRRQKALEEERKKEIEERTKQLLVEKKNPILFSSKEEKKDINESNKKVQKTSTQIPPLKRTTTTKESQIFQKKETTPFKTNTTPVFPPQSRINKTSYTTPNKTTIHTNDDIFSRERKNPRRVDEGIPVIKNERLNSNVVSAQKERRQEEVFPKVKLNKEEEIFPTFPKLNKNDSFFDDEEFNDLNNFMEDNDKKSWF